ncbi:MAG: Arc family DNA-binding protein [Chitinivibrionales bacterium]|nr:Arc family DNA-binding protein [Chitinivibrionales bacterium]
MATIQVREVPDELYMKLKEQARSHHRSIAKEILHILEQSVGSAREYEAVFRDIEATRLKVAEEFGTPASSVGLIREDRER